MCIDHWRKKENDRTEQYREIKRKAEVWDGLRVYQHWQRKKMTGLKHIERSSVGLKFGMVGVCIDHWRKKENDRTEQYREIKRKAEVWDGLRVYQHWQRKKMTGQKHIGRSSVGLKFGMVGVCIDHWRKKENDRTETYWKIKRRAEVRDGGRVYRSLA